MVSSVPRGLQLLTYRRGSLSSCAGINDCRGRCRFLSLDHCHEMRVFAVRETHSRVFLHLHPYLPFPCPPCPRLSCGRYGDHDGRDHGGHDHDDRDDHDHDHDVHDDHGDDVHDDDHDDDHDHFRDLLSPEGYSIQSKDGTQQDWIQ
ncbi:hypothetical protein P691DRAFT_581277 [Macrolepiota fuliginosa MF-IS2]|uniref:Uncharacterized protein n=1 Tax=Macrolepiota fuliginosa MF-IS2 TaxID=1400762 RepID=A0A9P5XN98_9AGAR|nr:hypothetical protein P691DRAFT_581277 [Macrolepiota fuliginosa MF-IS2]